MTNDVDHCRYLVEIAENIWETMLGLTVRDEPAGAPETHQAVAASVHVSGAWDGLVLVKCSSKLARRAAGRIFETDGEKLSSADVQDAVGELANMTGGSFKNLLASPTHLSLPTVVEGPSYTLRIPGSRSVGEVVLSCGEEPLTISLLQRAAV